MWKGQLLGHVIGGENFFSLFNFKKLNSEKMFSPTTRVPNLPICTGQETFPSKYTVRDKGKSCLKFLSPFNKKRRPQKLEHVSQANAGNCETSLN